MIILLRDRQIIISAKGRKGISITINFTPNYIALGILGYKFPMQIRIFKDFKGAFFIQHLSGLALSPFFIILKLTLFMD